MPAVEIRNRVKRTIRCNISIFETLSALPFSKISAKIASESQSFDAAIRKGRIRLVESCFMYLVHAHTYGKDRDV